MNTSTVDNSLKSYVAPARLVSEHRHEFRTGVLEALEDAAGANQPVIVIDLAATVEIDASGLGVLVLLQKRARERGLRTQLTDAPRSVRQILSTTRLDSLFEFERAL